jgi:DNA (cytosine-5)-methyltransferase 1
LYWANFILPNNLNERKEGKGLVCAHVKDEVKKLSEFHDFDFTQYNGEQRIDKMARNLVDYEAGKTILETALNIIRKSDTKQTSIFDYL